jgi:ankyrin repeat protein
VRLYITVGRKRINQIKSFNLSLYPTARAWRPSLPVSSALCGKPNKQMKKVISLICLIVGLSILSLKGAALLDLNNAVAQKSLSRIDFLLKIGFDPNKKDSNGYTPLHFAAINGDEKVTHTLIEAGANILMPVMIRGHYQLNQQLHLGIKKSWNFW